MAGPRQDLVLVGVSAFLPGAAGVVDVEGRLLLDRGAGLSDGESALAGRRGCNDGAAGLVELGHTVFARVGTFGRPRVSDIGPAGGRAVTGGDGRRRIVPADNPVDVLEMRTVRPLADGRIVDRQAAGGWAEAAGDRGARATDVDHAINIVEAGATARPLDPRVLDAKAAVAGATASADGSAVFGPARDTEIIVPPSLFPNIGDLTDIIRWSASKVLRDDRIVCELAVDDPEPVEAAPVAAGFDHGKPDPCFPLERRDAVHRAGAKIARHRHLAEDIADRLQAMLVRHVEERRDLLFVACHQQEALPRLRQATDLAAIVRGFVDGIAVVPEQLDNLVQQMPPSGHDPWNVLENDQANGIILEGLEGQPDAAQGELVQRLVLGREAHAFGEQPGEAFAGRRQENDVGRLVLRRSVDVARSRGAPAGRRHVAMERDILLDREQVHDGARDTGELFEIAHTGRIDVDAAEALKPRLHIADAGLTGIESLRAAAKAAEDMKMRDVDSAHRNSPGKLNAQQGRRRAATTPALLGGSGEQGQLPGRALPHAVEMGFDALHEVRQEAQAPALGALQEAGGCALAERLKPAGEEVLERRCFDGERIGAHVGGKHPVAHVPGGFPGIAAAQGHILVPGGVVGLRIMDPIGDPTGDLGRDGRADEPPPRIALHRLARLRPARGHALQSFRVFDVWCAQRTVGEQDRRGAGQSDRRSRLERWNDVDTESEACQALRPKKTYGCAFVDLLAVVAACRRHTAIVGQEDLARIVVKRRDDENPEAALWNAEMCRVDHAIGPPVTKVLEILGDDLDACSVIELEHVRHILQNDPFDFGPRTEVEWVILENVPYMLELDDGTGIKVVTQYLEHLGYRWAYRVVDSAHFGVPQRRLRVFIVASLHYDPREVLLSDDCGVPPARRDNSQQIDESASIGFFWTEGLTGLGLGIDVVPPLKAGSTIGLPSAPAILLPDGTLGTPHIEDAERLQGMPAGWTKPGETVQRNSRWRLVGSAVTTQVASWIADRIHDPKPYDSSRDQYVPLGGRYPRKAAWNMGNGVFAADVSANPLAIKAPPLQDFLTRRLEPLSERATAGFLERAKRGRLRFPPNFLQRVEAHLDRMRQGSSGQLALFS